MKKVIAFIDGFNLYHALANLGHPSLRWVDLWALMERQISPKSEKLEAVYYFSAYAHWLPDPVKRHKKYVTALEQFGVTPVMGHFKNKHRKCNDCGSTWVAHEEKESDVNIALYLLNEAYKGNYDKALIVSRDSDFKPAIEMTLAEFPDLEIVVVAPPHMGHSNDLKNVATSIRKITKKQVQESLLPQKAHDDQGIELVIRPEKYDPEETS